MSADYFVVGPRLLLRGWAAAPDENRLPLTLSIEDEQRRPLGHACGEEAGDAVGLKVSWYERVAAEVAAEAYRVLARVASRITGHRRDMLVTEVGPVLRARLAVDGFVVEKTGLRRAARPFVRDLKARSMDEVYGDPYSVPWNFVPRDRDILDELGAVEAPGCRVLDLGCGFGKNTSWLEERGFVVFGIDVSPTAIAHCRRAVQHPERLAVASATALPFATGQFDVVLDIGCLHCIAPALRPALTAEIRRVLRVNGRFWSRSFKPRPAEWVRRQPFSASGFGLTEAELMAVLRPGFDVTPFRPAETMNYFYASPRHP